MIFKKILRYLTVASLAILTIFLITSHKTKAEDTSKLLDSKAVQKIVKRGTLNVGVKQDVPNFGYYSAKTNTYEGMEVDLAKKIADELKVKVNYIPVTTQTREPLMDNGTIDLLIATYTINDERKASYAISTPYYYDQIGFLVLKDSGINKISDLNGKTIGDVLAVMQKLAKGGMNMVVVTHEMGFARSVADRIIFMAEGQVLVDTTDVDGFFDNPTEPRAVQFLSKIIDHNSDNVQVDA